MWAAIFGFLGLLVTLIFDEHDSDQLRAEVRFLVDKCY